MRGRRFPSFLPMVLLSLLVLFLPPVMAQETTGGIQGTVKDPTGAVIPGAEVVASSPALIGTQRATADSVGFYRFLNLPPGEYTLEVTAQGFRKYTEKGVHLEVGRLLPLDFQLEVGAITQVVEVQATPVIVDTTQSKVAVNIPTQVIATLPKGRSFSELITFAPGARYEPLQSASLTGGTNPVAVPGYQIDGASDSENVYALEGLDTSDIYGGGVGQNVPLDFVDELVIKSSGFEAEFGGALGGVVNIVTKKGGNSWHGSGLAYYRATDLSAKPRDTLRLDPEAEVFPEPYQYYQPKDDDWHIWEPGFEIGGFVKKDLLWLYGSYLPSLERRFRTVQFEDGWARDFKRTDRTQYGLARLDFSPKSSIRSTFNWNYAFRRWKGDRPDADSEFGQTNPYAATDPNLYNPERGAVMPNNAYVASAYFTPSPTMVGSVRFGYWYNDYQDRGTATGIRHQFFRSSIGLVGLDGTPVPEEYQGPRLFQTLPEVRQTVFDRFSRIGFNADWSWFVRGAGAHTFKAGYAMNRIHNDVFYGPNRAWVREYWGYNYVPITESGDAVCADLRAYNLATYGRDVCRGNFGVYRVIDFSTVGNVASNNHSLYVQDAWNLGGRVTLNLGVRFDKEYLPSFTKGADVLSTPIKFGFADKVAPRLGGAVDVLGNGKLKLYSSWGMYYDIMKYAMPRGSFGGDYWHDCWFTLDNANYTLIAPVLDANNHSCPGAGGMPGTKIEEIDWRIPSNDPETLPPPSIIPELVGCRTDEAGNTRCNRIQKDMKPMRSRRFDLGAEYAVLSDLGLEIRYIRSRLDYTIEDLGILGPGGEEYYIGNPGYGLSPLMLKDECPTCPGMPKAVRNYDGFELRAIKRWSRNWFANASYTYSRLWGNYAGLTSTAVGDAGGGRHDPNVSRYFDLVPMTYDAHGNVTHGFLPTDRPHTFKFYGAYRVKWLGMESTFGATQLAFSGVPLTTEIPMISHTPVHPEGIGNWIDLTADAEGIVTGGGPVIKNRRTPSFTNTDFLFTHDFKPSKRYENLRVTFEVNVANLLNQRHTLRYFTNPIRDGQINIGLEEFFRGFDYISAMGTQGDIYLDKRYGLGDAFWPGRTLRLKLKFNF